MENTINQIRIAILAIWAVIASALAPTINAMIVLIIFSLVNMFIGYQANSITKGERFMFSKAWNAIQQLAFYMAMVVLMHIAFWLFGDVEISEIAIKAICWVGVWGYTVKILQNFLLIFPKTRGVRLLYYFIAIKFIPKLMQRLGIDVSEEYMKEFNEENDIKQ